MNYIEVDISLSTKYPYCEIVSARLNEIKFESFLETDNGIKAYIQKDLFNSEMLEQCFSNIVNEIEYSIKVNEIQQENWNEKWENSFKPIKIKKNCIIRAEFHKKTHLDYDIVINPKMSFGTGHHATTFLMMNRMFDIDLVNTNVLDVGCGTGVLSILAEKLGAKSILGIDIDEWSVQNSKENKILNNSKKVKVKKCTVSSLIDYKCDIILANINRNVIVNDLNKYEGILNNGGQLLLSGFFDIDKDIIINESKKTGLYLDYKESKSNWLLLNFRK